MRRTLASALVVVVVAVVVAIPHSAAAQQGKTEQELMQIERDWCAANVKADKAAVGRIVSDDLTAISSVGKIQTKAEMIADLKPGALTSCQADMMKVRVYGDTAIVTGRNTVSGVDDKKVAFSNRQVMWTDTFMKRDGKWLCIATQSSRVPQ